MRSGLARMLGAVRSAVGAKEKQSLITIWTTPKAVSAGSRWAASLLTNNSVSYTHLTLPTSDIVKI